MKKNNLMYAYLKTILNINEQKQIITLQVTLVGYKVSITV